MKHCHSSSSEVYAAREKNGVYIPKERYQQEESERKVGQVFTACNISNQLLVFLESSSYFSFYHENFPS